MKSGGYYIKENNYEETIFSLRYIDMRNFHRGHGPG